MRTRSVALMIALGAAVLVAGAAYSAAAERTRLSAETFKSTQKLTRKLVDGLDPRQSFYLSKADLGRVLKGQVADASLKARLGASHRAGTLTGIALRKVRYTVSARPYDLLLLYDGTLAGLLLAEGSWQAADGGDGGGGGAGGDGGEDSDTKTCPYHYCNIQGQQCQCEASTIEVPENETCPADNTNCCADYMCDETSGTGGTAPPNLDDIF